MTGAIIVAVVCLLAEALFSGSEIAIIAADRLRLRQRADAGGRAERLLLGMLANPQRLLATTLIGTQLAVVTATVTVTLTLGELFPDRNAELYTLLCLTPMLVMFGEIVPKSIAQQHADRLAPRVVYVLWVAERLFSPLVWWMAKFTGQVAKLLGIEAHGKTVTREELEWIMKGGNGRGGEITEGERRMISRIFDFGDRTAYDVMVPLSSVTALEEGMEFEEAVREVEEKGYSRFPVYRERIDRIVGIVHTFEMLKAGGRKVTVGALMQPPIFIPENQLLVDVLVELQRSRKGMAVVVDEYGGAVGVVTIEDILEEIVGEIEDEYDVAPSAIRRESDGVWRVRADTPIREINRQLRLELPEGEDYEAIAGLLLDRLKHIPRIGESVRIGGVLLKVIAASERAIEDVELRVARRRA